MSRLVHGADIIGQIEHLSYRDVKPFVHAHAVLTYSGGHTMGGHLISGRVFAAELCLRELLGAPLVRRHDVTTGLYLWDEP